MLEESLLCQNIKTVLCRTDIDSSVSALADTAHLGTENIIFEIAEGLVAVITYQSLFLGNQPYPLLLIFYHAVYPDDVSKCSTHLVRIILVGKTKKSMTRGSDQYFSVLPLQKAGDVRWHDMVLQVVYLDVLEAVAIKRLQGTIHTHIEKSVTVLHHAVDIVACHSQFRFLLFLKQSELITVIFVQSITGCHPDESIPIEVNLTDETT